MGRIPEQLRRNIGANLRRLRMQLFPGRGGAQTCARAFGVSPQQWSPWERGLRTPDENRLARLAAFFGVSVEELMLEVPGKDGEKHECLPRETGGVAVVPDAVAYTHAITRVLNQINKTDLRVAVPFMNCLADLLEWDAEKSGNDNSI